jgi:hypothetical protein
MAQPSKVGTTFLFLFALPFLGGGLFFLYALLVSRQNFRNGDVKVGVAIAIFFVFIGGGLIIASFTGYGLLKQKAALEEPTRSRHGFGVPIGLLAVAIA